MFVLSLLTSALLASGFTEMRDEAGIRFVNVSGDAAKSYILGSLGGGVGLIDYDGDGDLDLYFVNGRRLEAGIARPEGGNQLYRNDGGWKFVDVSVDAGVADEGWGVGCAVGDFDDDGLDDLYVTNIGPNVLYRNRGDGTFQDVTDDVGGGDVGFGSSAAFADTDGDGDLDLYVANYVDPDLSKIPAPDGDPTCVWLGKPVMCGPRGLDGGADVFYRNDDGVFVDATETAGLVDSGRFFGLGVVSADYDGDGDADLYVANDTQPNYLYENDGRGRFHEVGLLVGAAYNVSGATEAGMGVDFGDPNGDGALDLFVTNFSHETNTLYVGSSAGLFTDETEESGLGTPSLGWLGWGTRFADFDNDGDEDLFVANGHVYPGVEEVDDSTAYRQENQVYWNRGDGVFPDVSNLEEKAPSRGAAFGDLDGDGDVDVVLVNADEEPSLLRNDSDPSNAFFGLHLIGVASNRDAETASVRIVVAGRTQLRYVHGSGSILSSNDRRLLFGLGGATIVDEVEIRWPSGEVTVLRDLPVRRYWTVLEGRDEAVSVAPAASGR